VPFDEWTGHREKSDQRCTTCLALADDAEHAMLGNGRRADAADQRRCVVIANREECRSEPDAFGDSGPSAVPAIPRNLKHVAGRWRVVEERLRHQRRRRGGRPKHGHVNHASTREYIVGRDIERMLATEEHTGDLDSRRRTALRIFEQACRRHQVEDDAGLSIFTVDESAGSGDVATIRDDLEPKHGVVCRRVYGGASRCRGGEQRAEEQPALGGSHAALKSTRSANARAAVSQGSGVPGGWCAGKSAESAQLLFERYRRSTHVNKASLQLRVFRHEAQRADLRIRANLDVNFNHAAETDGDVVTKPDVRRLDDAALDGMP
jgi:hypothetical protein